METEYSVLPFIFVKASPGVDGGVSIVSVPALKPVAAFQSVTATTSKVTVYVPTADGAVVLPLYLTVTVPVDLPDFAVTVTVLALPS